LSAKRGPFSLSLLAKEEQNEKVLRRSYSLTVRQTVSKYDYRYSVLLFVFARLLKKGWIMAPDLQELADDKIEAIRYLAGYGESGTAAQ
jgi:hypothetical protein